MDGMDAKNDEAKIEFWKAAMNEQGEGQEENLETKQNLVEEAAGKWRTPQPLIETKQ